MSDEIKEGDVVRLKSGGPKMVVTSIGEEAWGGDGKPSVWCEWFDEKHMPQKGTFKLASVEKVPPGATQSELHRR